MLGAAVRCYVTFGSMKRCGPGVPPTPALRQPGAESTSAAEDGGALTRELMQRMGHSSMRAALIDQRATDERLHELADRLGALLGRERETT
ncbi:hypothetical protein CAE01nite_16910 [Cellulomonas aerilata]|uniref:Uncharacterized protein n=1 Tax=Cellulomonas aerilata TaxID=515326 RepID=A0A512DBX1_9CELL|nr:hypothetical protein CAE01nite_16910 [Cellulomonas aerilata]